MNIAISCLIIGLFLILVSSVYLYETWKESPNKGKFVLDEIISLFIGGSIYSGVSFYALIGLIVTIFGLYLLFQELTL